ncbi:MAG: ABC transporter ATP-binding protein, partial [Acholeplasmataceae bacterium]
ETLQRLPFSYFDKTPHGWIMARMTSDSRRLANIISWGLVDFLWSFVIMGAILVILYVFSWKLALIVTISIPIMSVLAYFFRRKILKGYRESRKMNSKVTASFNEAFIGAKTTKSLAIESEASLMFKQQTKDLRRASTKAIIWSAVFSPVMLVISYIVVGAIMLKGSFDIITLGFSVALITTLYIFIDYTNRFFEPIMQVARILAQFQQAQASAERLIQLIEETPAIYDEASVVEKYGDLLHPKYENWEDLNGDVEFRNVSFNYVEDEPILTDFNLHIKAGTQVALVGHTGSGKTTIINLLSRFYEPVSGQILIDGTDYKKRSIHWLHKRLGYVLQTPHLFSGNIMENIRYGNLEATDEEVINAAKLIGAHTFIEKLSDGYYTDIGEGGSKLSVGEKQLISFARAIIADPKILILDEATSSIDSEAEQVIQSATHKLLKGRTSFIVAHRLSTIVDADLIILLESGKIIEMGTHKELLELKSHYFNLYKNQFILEKSKELESLLD